MTISCWGIVRMRSDLDKSCRENQNTFYVQYLVSENRAACDIMSKNMVEPERPQMTIQYFLYALRDA